MQAAGNVEPPPLSCALPSSATTLADGSICRTVTPQLDLLSSFLGHRRTLTQSRRRNDRPSIVSAPSQLARTPPTPPHAVLQPLAAPPSGKAKLPSAAFPRNTRLEPRLSANSTHPRRRACVCESVAVAVSVSVFRRVSYLPLLITLRLRGHRIRGSSLPEFRITQHIPLVGLQRRLAAHGRVSGLSSPARLVAPQIGRAHV